MIARPKRPDPARVAAALGLQAEPMFGASTDWLANTMRIPRRYPIGGPGWYPGPNDLRRAVDLVLGSADDDERALAREAVGRCLAWSAGITAREYPDAREAGILAALPDDDRADVLRMGELLAELHRRAWARKIGASA